MYNFDNAVERRGSDCEKWDGLASHFGSDDLIALWVADTDFEAPDFIMDALRKRLEHPVLGYATVPTDYWPSVIDWTASHHQWQLQREWLCYVPGIVKGIAMAINVLVKPDEKVIIQPPVYHPFRSVVLGNKREIVYNPLRQNVDGSYEMDFEQLASVVDEKCRMIIISNPHNPGGVVWSRETLQRLAQFCYERNIIIISDEIHCDLALWDNKHVPLATVSPEAEQCTITFAAPTKTFNVAGIVSSYAIVPNEQLRKPFYHWMSANGFNSPNLFAPIVTIATYRQGEAWRQAFLRYIESNILFVEDYCAKHIPQIKALRPQASYLVWLDCRALALSHNALIDLFINKARLALNDGEMFGKGGEGFMRMNVGTSRKILQQALNQLAQAVNELQIELTT